MAMQPTSSSYPATLTFDPPEKVANWRPLLNWLFAIPHFVILYGLRILAQVVGIISWFVILFTGELPENFANIQAMYMRYELRTYTYALFMREEYPPFAFAMTPTDGGEEPRVGVEFRPQLADRNRLTVGFRIILVIPQVIALFVLQIVAFVLIVIAFFAVLFTGRWPEGMRTTVLNITRWYLRVQTYWLLLTDEYPPFTLEPQG
jgi:small-conductance mechanosensitive channel